ncbi:MAG: hypothetical protein ACT4PL_01495 [Phycisphaerales bacterium]
MQKSPLACLTAICGTGLSVLVCIPVGSAASVIEHSNAERTFVWRANPGFAGGVGDLLEPLLSANQQSEAVFSRSLFYVAGVGGGSESPQGDAVQGSATMRVVQSPIPLLITNRFGVVTTFQPLQAIPAGSLLGASANYRNFGTAAIYYLGGNMVHAPLLGQSAFIGFNMTLADGPHYGFVELMFTTGPVGNSGEIIPMYQPLRWAYESQPNVPIVVPGPGPALAFVLFAPLAVRRRRGLPCCGARLRSLVRGDCVRDRRSPERGDTTHLAAGGGRGFIITAAGSQWTTCRPSGRMIALHAPPPSRRTNAATSKGVRLPPSHWRRAGPA